MQTMIIDHLLFPNDEGFFTQHGWSVSMTVPLNPSMVCFPCTHRSGIYVGKMKCPTELLNPIKLAEMRNTVADLPALFSADE